ncbi:MAG: MFS transporter, partial [Pseudomonadota bacterium]
GIFMFFVGRWQERYGLRRMMTVGAAIFGLNLLLITWATSLFELYLWAFINGVAYSFIYVPALTTVQRWFPAKRGTVSGMVNLCLGMSGAVMAPVFSYLLTALGYVPMNLLLAAATLVVSVSAAQFSDPPEITAAEPPAKPPAAPGRPAGPGSSLTVGQTLKTRNFWLLWIIAILQGAAGVSMITLSITFGLSQGLTLPSAVIILTAWNIGNGAGRFLLGFLSDVLGRNFTLCLAALAAAASYFALPYVPGLAAAAVMAGLIGMAFGALFSVGAPLASDCFGLAHFGAIFGLIFTGHSFFGGLIGPGLSGLILDLTHGSFDLVFLYLGVFSLGASGLIWLVRPPHALETQ